MKTHFKFVLPFFLAVLLVNSERLNARADTMYVSKGYIYSSAGEKVILRGTNEMFVWLKEESGKRLIPEIGKTGSNCLRFVWSENEKTKEELVMLMDTCIALKMIAMPECHDCTGDWDKFEDCLQFWNDPTLIAGIQKNRQWTLLNIANEIGNHEVSDSMFVVDNKRAIDSLRKWGYTVPIVIDAPGWGQNIDMLLKNGKEVLEHDPLNNVIFSTHSYWSPEDAIVNYNKVAEGIKDGICIIIGEGPSITRFPSCSFTPLPYLEGMQICQENEVGWLSWSWGGVDNSDCNEYGYFDHTHNGEFGQWESQSGAFQVAEDNNSIMQSSERPASFFKDNIVPVSGIYIAPNIKEIHVGDTLFLDVIVAPANAVKKDYSLKIVKGKNLVSYNKNTESIIAKSPGTLTVLAKYSRSLSFQRTISIK